MTADNGSRWRLRQDAEDRLREIHLPDDKLAQVREAVGLADPRSGVQRVHRHFSMPDAAGHMRYLGKMPARHAQPLLTYNGKRIPASNYAMVTIGNDPFMADVPLRRNLALCPNVPECFAPAHWMPTRSPEPATNPSSLELLYHARHGEPPNPRPTRWDKSDPWKPKCPRGHDLQTYALRDGRNRSYCAECYQANREWHRRHDAWERSRGYTFAPAEDYILQLWNRDPVPEALGDLIELWRGLDAHYASNPSDTRSPQQVHEDVESFDSAPEEPEQTMQEAVDAMFASFDAEP